MPGRPGHPRCGTARTTTLTPRGRRRWEPWTPSGQGLTLLHLSALPEPGLSLKHHPMDPSKVLTLSWKVEKCSPCEWAASLVDIAPMPVGRTSPPRYAAAAAAPSLVDISPMPPPGRTSPPRYAAAAAADDEEEEYKAAEATETAAAAAAATAAAEADDESYLSLAATATAIRALGYRAPGSGPEDAPDSEVEPPTPTPRAQPMRVALEVREDEGDEREEDTAVRPVQASEAAATAAWASGSGAGAVGAAGAGGGWRQGLTLVHWLSKPDPLLSL